MATKPKSPPTNQHPKQPSESHPVIAPPLGNEHPVTTGNPQFGQPTPSPDPTQFVIKHGSD